MAETRAFLVALGAYGATERELRARGVDLGPLGDALRLRYVQRYEYPEEKGWCYRLTEAGNALRQREEARLRRLAEREEGVA